MAQSQTGRQHLKPATSILQGSATLSMAYAGALFADACLRGLNGESNIFDYTYVESEVTEVPYFASKVELGPDGELRIMKRVVVIPAALPSANHPDLLT